MLFLKKVLKSYIMSFHVGASGVNGSSRVRNCGTQDTRKENNREIYTPCLKEARPELESERAAEEERTSSVEQLLRPALPGRKVYKRSCKEDNRGRWREKNQNKDDNRQNIEDVGGREGGKQRQKRPARTETHGDVQHERQVAGSSESLSSSNSDIQCNHFLEAGEGLDNLWRGREYPRPHNIDCIHTSMTNLNAESPWLAMTSMSSVLPQLPIQTRSTTLSPRRLSCSAVTGDSVQFPFSPSREPDPFWVKVRSRAATEQSLQSHYTQKHITSLTSSELGEEEENEEEGDQHVGDGKVRGSGVMEVMCQTMIPGVARQCVLTEEKRMSKREKNRIKCLRRRHRRRERWKQSQLQESRQRSTGNPSSSNSSSSEDEECVSARDREGYICAVCLDVYFSPYMCHPCNHIFCEPCLRTLAKNSPSSTPCPLCRTIITHVFFQKELSQTAKTYFPKEYLLRKQNFQKASCAKWPLPSCRKLFHIFGGFQRQSGPIPRHQLPHREGYRMDAMDFEDNPHRRRFDMDMIIIYIYSVNWIIGFFIFCFLCYLFFPSF